MKTLKHNNSYKFNFPFHLFRFTKFVRPACLWQTKDVNFTSSIATGFGLTEYAGDTSDKLMKVKHKTKLLLQRFY